MTYGLSPPALGQALTLTNASGRCVVTKGESFVCMVVSIAGLMNNSTCRWWCAKIDRKILGTRMQQTLQLGGGNHAAELLPSSVHTEAPVGSLPWGRAPQCALVEVMMIETV